MLEVVSHRFLGDLPREAFSWAQDGANLGITEEWLRFQEADFGGSTYFMAIEGDSPVALVPCYENSLDERSSLDCYYMPDKLVPLGAATVRLRSLLTQPFALAGNRAGYENQLAVRANTTATTRQISEAVLSRIEAWAADRGRLVTFMHATSQTAAQISEVSGVASVLCAPTMGMNVEWQTFAEYVAALGSHRDRVVARDMRMFRESGATIEISRLHGRVDALTPLLHHLGERYAHEDTADRLREHLRHQVEALDENSVVFLARNHGTTIGFALGYRFGPFLHMRLCGFDYLRTVKAGAYFTLMFYEPVAYAIRNGIRRIEFGPGTFEAKALRGCTPTARWAVVVGKQFVADDVQEAVRRVNEARIAYFSDLLSPLCGKEIGSDWPIAGPR